MLTALRMASIGLCATLDIVWLNSSFNDPLAVCNDGTPPAYYFAKATNASFSDYWLFFLEGGGQCYSEASCKSRSSTMKSSKSYTSTMTEGGIFSTDSSASSFSGVNKVYVKYCTSDGWIGDAAASDMTWGYQFRGQRVVRSALNDLIQKGLIISKSTVMFGGGSAGARGMMNNVDFLVDLLPNMATVHGAFLDSCFTIDIDPYDPAFVGFRYETQEIFLRYNVTAIIPDDCATAYPGDEMWKCNMGQYRMAFLKTPYVLVASQYDQYQLSNNIGVDPVDGVYPEQAMLDYADQWAQQTNALLVDLATKSKTNSFIHSVSCTLLLYLL